MYNKRKIRQSFLRQFRPHQIFDIYSVLVDFVSVNFGFYEKKENEIADHEKLFHSRAVLNINDCESGSKYVTSDSLALYTPRGISTFRRCKNFCYTWVLMHHKCIQSFKDFLLTEIEPFCAWHFFSSVTIFSLGRIADVCKTHQAIIIVAVRYVTLTCIKVLCNRWTSVELDWCYLMRYQMFIRVSGYTFDWIAIFWSKFMCG